jgi:hypothetical protein
MSTDLIFAAGVICFALTMIGAILTVYEFKRIARANPQPSAPLAPSPIAVEFVHGRVSSEFGQDS